MSTTDHASPYGLARPTLADAREAVHRVHGDAGATVWSRLMTGASLTGREADQQSFERLLHAMGTADPVTRLCGQALLIRMTSYTHLLAAHTATRSSQ